MRPQLADGKTHRKLREPLPTPITHGPLNFMEKKETLVPAALLRGRFVRMGMGEKIHLDDIYMKEINIPSEPHYRKRYRINIRLAPATRLHMVGLPWRH